MHGRCQEREDPPASLHIGPLASNLCDVAYVYRLLAFFAPQAPLPTRPDWPATVPLGRPPREPILAEPKLKGVRIGIFSPWLEDSIPLFARECLTVLDHLVTAHGASKVEVGVPALEDVRVAHAVSIMRDMLSTCTADGILENDVMRMQLGLDARAKLAIVRDFTDDDEAASEVVRARAIGNMYSIFTKVDILLTPTIGENPSLVPRNLETGQLDVMADSAAMRFCLLANLTGIPAIAFPAGGPSVETNIRPSVQLMGAPWSEDVLLRVAACSNL